MSKEILHSRYNHLLKQLQNLDHASDALYKKGFISLGEKEDVRSVSTEGEKKDILCDFLTVKGVSLLVKVSEALTIEQKGQCGASGSGSVVVVTTSSSTSSSTGSSGASGDRDFEGERGGDGRREESGGVPHRPEEDGYFGGK